MRTETRGPTLISFFFTESQYLQTIAEQNLRSPANDEAEPHKTANSYHLLPTNTAASGGSAPRFKSSSIGGRNSSRCVRLLPAQLRICPQGLRCTMQHFIGLSRKLRPVFSQKGPLAHLLLYSGMHTEDTSWITLPVPSANIILFKF